MDPSVAVFLLHASFISIISISRPRSLARQHPSRKTALSVSLPLHHLRSHGRGPAACKVWGTEAQGPVDYEGEAAACPGWLGSKQQTAEVVDCHSALAPRPQHQRGPPASNGGTLGVHQRPAVSGQVHAVQALLVAGSFSSAALSGSCPVGSSTQGHAQPNTAEPTCLQTSFVCSYHLAWLTRITPTLRHGPQLNKLT